MDSSAQSNCCCSRADTAKTPMAVISNNLLRNRCKTDGLVRGAMFGGAWCAGSRQLARGEPRVVTRTSTPSARLCKLPHLDRRSGPRFFLICDFLRGRGLAAAVSAPPSDDGVTCNLFPPIGDESACG